MEAPRRGGRTDPQGEDEERSHHEEDGEWSVTERTNNGGTVEMRKNRGKEASQRGGIMERHEKEGNAIRFYEFGNERKRGNQIWELMTYIASATRMQKFSDAFCWPGQRRMQRYQVYVYTASSSQSRRRRVYVEEGACQVSYLLSLIQYHGVEDSLGRESENDALVSGRPMLMRQRVRNENISKTGTPEQQIRQ
ncbi:hypothetical protein VNO80_24934 [Phaseolus coccineus]|uniref:Uncharacterized protein n=1 Tax=Phaseolus coccineus TaxID=3886 RepID=A0AAN9LYI5_PHACN